MTRGELVGDELRKMEGDLKALVLEEFEGVKVRSRAEWIEDGEKPSRFFFSLMREREKTNRMEGLKDVRGVERSDQGEMLKVVEDFYRELFKQEEVDEGVQGDLLRAVGRSLDGEARGRCEGNLSENELVGALESMSLGKSPGEDGLSVEFFRCSICIHRISMGIKRKLHI